MSELCILQKRCSNRESQRHMGCRGLPWVIRFEKRFSTHDGNRERELPRLWSHWCLMRCSLSRGTCFVPRLLLLACGVSARRAIVMAAGSQPPQQVSLASLRFSSLQTIERWHHFAGSRTKPPAGRQAHDIFTSGRSYQKFGQVLPCSQCPTLIT